jgi:hypothetical protein
MPLPSEKGEIGTEKHTERGGAMGRARQRAEWVSLTQGPLRTVATRPWERDMDLIPSQSTQEEVAVMKLYFRFLASGTVRW